MIKTTYSQKTDIKQAIGEIKQNLQSINVHTLVYFASSYYKPDELAKAINENFQGTTNIGCTTAGEITTGKMLKNSIVVMAFDNKSIDDIKVEVVENIDKKVDIEPAFNNFEAHFNQSMKKLNYKEYVGIVLIDGLSKSEEKLMDTIGTKTGIVFVGGSAGDDLKFEQTYTFVNGKKYSNAAVLAVMKPAGNFDFIKTQSFCQLDSKLTATKVNEEMREVIEFNKQPAAKAYSKALNIENSSDLADYFMKNPIGLMVGDEPYVRSPQQVKGDNIIFYCQIKEGMQLSLLETKSMIPDTEKAIKDKEKELGKISGIINFHCILRTLDLEAKNQTEEYGKIFDKIPTIGFSTYGEEFVGHINQTATMLVFA